jgi:hypothetical protein
MILCFAVFGMVMIGNNVFADPNDSEEPGEGGGVNTATCYSTYTSPGFLGTGTNIWRCGSCESVIAKSFSDPGICYF